MRVRPMGRPRVIESVACPNCGHDVVIATHDALSFVSEPTVAAPVVEVPDVTEVRATVLVLLRALVEVIAGRRQMATLAGSLSGPVQRYARAAMLRYRGEPVRIGSAHLARPVETAVEAVVVIETGDRVRALAVGLRQVPGGGWFCHTLRIL